MKRCISIFLVVVCMITGCGNQKLRTAAESTIPLTDKEYQAFSGQIENEPVVMIIYREEELLTVYYSDKMRTHTNLLTGAYDTEKNSFLLISAETGESFEGVYCSIEDNTDNHSKNFLIGILTTADGSQKEVSAEYVRSYENHESTKATFYREGIWDYDPFVVMSFIEIFAAAVFVDDKETLAGMMEYPLSVGLDEGDIKIENAEEFVEAYDHIITDYTKERVQKGFETNLFINYMGVNFGGVILFYSTDNGIFRINNLTKSREHKEPHIQKG